MSIGSSPAGPLGSVAAARPESLLLARSICCLHRPASRSAPSLESQWRSVSHSFHAIEIQDPSFAVQANSCDRSSLPDFRAGSAHQTDAVVLLAELFAWRFDGPRKIR